MQRMCVRSSRIDKNVGWGVLQESVQNMRPKVIWKLQCVDRKFQIDLDQIYKTEQHNQVNFWNEEILMMASSSTNMKLDEPV